MKKRNFRPVSGNQSPFIIMIILLLIIFQHLPALAAPPSEDSYLASAAAMKLVQFCIDPRVGLDTQSVATLADYVLGAKPSKEADLPKLRNATGAYYEFDTRIEFSRFLKYSFNRQIPSVLTNPASLRYSQWIDQGNSKNISSICNLYAKDGQPIVMHGLEHVCITPDLNTGVYYKYDLKKTLILLKHKGRQVLISVSKQTDVSGVGKKGIILGSDNDWNYYYSAETGSTKTGLGWVKSYIYDYFSVGVYLPPNSSSSMVRSGVFSWIRAGWSGINFAETRHVIRGLQRYARSSKTVLESPKLPPPNQVASIYLKLSSLPRNVLDDKYAALQQARLQLASRKSSIGTSAAKQGNTYNGTSKEQILSELMLEYFKMNLGKPSLLANKDI